MILEGLASSWLFQGFATSVAYDLAKSKVLSLLPKQEAPAINDPLARALVRALADSLLERLAHWEKAHDDVDPSFVGLAQKRLKALVAESKNNGADWQPFIAQCNGEGLTRALESLHRQTPVDASSLAEQGLGFLRAAILTAESGQDVPEGFRAVVFENAGQVFRDTLYERFVQEVRNDAVTFRAFTSGFMAKIYDGVTRHFPDRDSLAQALTQLDEKIAQIPDETVRKIRESGIVLTIDQHREILKQEKDELERLLRTAHATEKALLEARLVDVQQALSDNRLLLRSYEGRIKDLEERITSLQTNGHALPADLLDQALAALRRGDTEAACTIFQQVEARGEPHIAAVAESKYQQGRIAKDKAAYFKARDLFVRATQLAPDNPAYLSAAGTIQDTLGAYDEAIDYHEQALEVVRKTFPKNHPNIATCLNNLGAAWCHKGAYDRAIDYFEQAFAMWRKTLPENHPAIAASLNNLGNAWSSKGDQDKAIHYYAHALEMRRKTLPENHPNIAANLNNLGNAWFHKGDYDKALDYHEQALEMLRKTLPENHPDIAMSLNNLGNAFAHKGDDDRAIAYYEQALEMKRKTLPENHPDIAASLNNLGAAWAHKGDDDKAIAYYAQALEMKGKTLPENHPDIAASLNNLGNAWFHKGDVDKAIAYYEQALEMKRKTLPENHPDVAGSLNNLGRAWGRKGDVDKALDYHAQALEMKRKTLPENHPDIAASLNNLGSVWGRKGDVDRAIDYFEQALGMWCKSLQENHPNIAMVQANLNRARQAKSSSV